MNRIVRVLCILLFSVCSQLVAQNSGTGLYPFVSFDSRGFDSVNIGNLNTHFEIPIVNKPGRGQNFNYILSYDGLIWSQASSSGTQSWVPDSAWGMRGQLNEGLAGYVTYKTTQERCYTDPSHPIWTTKTSNYVYYDAFGQRHALLYFTDECLGIPTDPTTVTTRDGSGYSFDGSNVYDRHGNLLSVPVVTGTPTGSASITDTNGNTIAGNGTFVDTLGVAALRITGAGNASAPRIFNYNVAEQADGSTTASITMSYVTYTVQTNFGCSGISEYGSTSIDLADRVMLADGSFYQFTYEPTPGVAGAVTGRLASVTLPTGGRISYSYTDGCNGSRINADGTVSSLTRVTTDGSRSYTRSPINANATSTTVQDEKGNQIVYKFTIANGLFYETRRDVYQGNTSGPHLFNQQTCYNGTAFPCDGTSLTLPIAQTEMVGKYAEYVLDVHGVEKRIRHQIVLSPVRVGERAIGKREAQRLLQPQVDRVNFSLSAPVSERKSASFEDFAAIWQRDYLSLSKPSTQSGARSSLKRLKAAFGKKDMRQIDAGDIQRFIASSVAEGLEPKTVRNLWGTVSLIWNAALAQKYVDAMLPKPKLPRRAKKRARFYTLIDVAKMIAASQGEHRAFYWLAAETGLRAGEIAGLRLSDIDGERLTVNQSVWGGKDQSPKSNSAIRTLGLSPQLISLLWEQIARQRAKGHEYLFSASTGRPVDMNVHRRRKMTTLLKSLAIPQAGFHAFRHFNVSLLDALRVPLKTIQERAGHALTGVFTLDVYGGSPEWERNLEAGRLAGSEIERAVSRLEKEANAEVVGSLLAIQEERLGSVIS